ncbi:MAG: DUF11 domain-containing protein [Actinobacteria bacterium]|nr:DUF11 domain-containing protein [Actinomycetota bacterium]
MDGRKSRWTSIRRVGLAALAVFALSASSALGAAGITLSRSPAPPAAAKIGAAGATGTEQIGYTVNYDSRGSRLVVRIVRAVGAPESATVQLIEDTTLADVDAQPGRQISKSVSWSVPNGIAPGRYYAEVRFYSNGVNVFEQPEASAATAFDVAPQLGNLQLVKYEDLNGNAVRDAGEPGVGNWPFTLTNPTGGVSGAVTTSDGTVLLTGVPAGTWQIQEGNLPGWAASSAPSGSAVVPDSGTGTFTVGNYRPARLSGVVYIDTNRNGRLDTPEESGRPNTGVTLVGTDGQGRPVTQRGMTGPGGGYGFTGLPPGTYAVTSDSVTGLSFTTPSTISGIILPSNGDRPRNNFGLAPGPTPIIAGGPILGIAKSGPSIFTPGLNFRYRVTVRNTSANIARNVVVTDPVPPLITLISRPSGATVAQGVITWRLGNLAPGARRTVTFLARIAVGAPVGTYRNTATATADGTTPVKASTTGILRRATRRPSGGVTG